MAKNRRRLSILSQEICHSSSPRGPAHAAAFPSSPPLTRRPASPRRRRRGSSCRSPCRRRRRRRSSGSPTTARVCSSGTGTSTRTRRRPPPPRRTAPPSRTSCRGADRDCFVDIVRANGRVAARDHRVLERVRREPAVRAANGEECAARRRGQNCVPEHGGRLREAQKRRRTR